MLRVWAQFFEIETQDDSEFWGESAKEMTHVHEIRLAAGGTESALDVRHDTFVHHVLGSSDGHFICSRRLPADKPLSCPPQRCRAP